MRAFSCFSLLAVLVLGTPWATLVAHAQEGSGAYIAYTFANQPTSGTYTPQAAYTLNPAGDVTVTRSSTGVYTVRFINLGTVYHERTRNAGTDGEAGGAGQVQVSAVDTPGAYCKVAGWDAGGASSDLTVNVRCFNAAGNLTDARYTVLFLEPQLNAGAMGFVWANEPGLSSYAPAGTRAYNSAGGHIQITHPSSGFYIVRFQRMGRYADPALAAGGGQVHVTGYGTDNTKCQITGWSLIDEDYRALVLCRTPSGGLTDARFSLLALWPETNVGTHAYAWATSLPLPPRTRPPRPTMMAAPYQ